ncbi:MAG TPA: hypothetical protein VKT28_01200 [Puia sp.]|nr:hypothetical protein [Puia sp.]
MNTNKFILAGIAGGIVFFFVGYLAYGVILANFSMSHAGPVKGVARDPAQMLFLYLIIGNLLYGFLFAYIFSKASIITVSKGAMVGAIIGFLISASFGFIQYSTTWLMGRTVVVVDAIAFAVISAIAGAVIAWIAGMGKK